MPNHAKCSHPWTVHTSRLLMSKNSIKNVLENLFLMFGRGKTQNRAKTHRPSMSAFSAIFVLKENGTQSHSAKFLNWGDHVNSVPDLAASHPGRAKSKTSWRHNHVYILSCKHASRPIRARVLSSLFYIYIYIGLQNFFFNESFSSLLCTRCQSLIIWTILWSFSRQRRLPLWP